MKKDLVTIMLLSFPGGVDYDDDFMSRAMSSRDPPDLWISTPDDQFPDPNLDAEGFMVYCGESFPRLTTYLWLVTREMVEKGEELKPIAIHEPFISRKLVRLTSMIKKLRSLYTASDVDL